MKVKQYTADSLQEAMLKVKSDLGLDAVILHTRRVKQGGVLGLFSREVFEVTATLDAKVPEVSTTKKEPANFSLSNNRVTALEMEVNQLRQAVEVVLKSQPRPERDRPYEALQEMLIQNDVDPGIAEKLVREVRIQLRNRQDSLAARQVLGELICRYVSRIEGIRLDNGCSKVVALLGPTGVGKTTTIAKLAANFTLIEGKKVALITADTYRIAAVEQLKTYADIIGVPVEVVFTRDELTRSLIHHADKDLVLVDTAGRSPKNDQHLQELSFLLREQPNLEYHLVISATTKPKDALDIVTRFAPTDAPYKLIVTKLDESDTLGAILNVMYNTKAILSYIANGQSVPDDIEIADAEKIVSLILRDCHYG
jgi:flagellar biosynthesis protein FlhF